MRSPTGPSSASSISDELYLPILDGALRTALPIQPVLTNPIQNHYTLNHNRNLSKVADHLIDPIQAFQASGAIPQILIAPVSCCGRHIATKTFPGAAN